MIITEYNEQWDKDNEQWDKEAAFTDGFVEGFKIGAVGKLKVNGASS